MISISVNDSQVLATLNELLSRGQNLRPAFAEIGEDLVESTKRRFATATGPGGSTWAANSPVTIAQYPGTTKKPLTGQSRALQTTIAYQLQGSMGVSIGSPSVYAAMQQFGGTKAQFPHLWGDIPARPFLGISTTDRANILDILGSYLVG